MGSGRSEKRDGIGSGIGIRTGMGIGIGKGEGGAPRNIRAGGH